MDGSRRLFSRQSVGCGVTTALRRIQLLTKLNTVAHYL